MQPKVRQLSFRLLSILSIGAYWLLVEGLVIIRNLPMGTGNQIIDIVDVFTVLVMYSVYPCTNRINFDECIIGFGRRQIRASYSLRWDLVLMGCTKPFHFWCRFWKSLSITKGTISTTSIFVHKVNCTWRLLVKVAVGSRWFLRGTGDQKINNFNIFVVFSTFSVHHCTYRISFGKCINARGAL